MVAPVKASAISDSSLSQMTTRRIIPGQRLTYRNRHPRAVDAVIGINDDLQKCVAIEFFEMALLPGSE
jgi:hypothetical protein